MQELNMVEVEQVGGGDGVATVGGILAGVAAGALVIGTGGGVLVGAALGGVIWEAGYRWLRYSNE